MVSVSSLDELGGRRLVGTVVSGGEPPGAVGPDEAVLIGSEARGLPGDVIAACDRLVSIPMTGGAESVNAAVAGAIVAYLGAEGDH